jgi:hypothetical protein
MSMNKDTGLVQAVYFPVLHRSLVRGALPGGVRFLEPGLAKVVPEGCFQPQGLPLPPVQAKRFLEESIRFGEQFKEPEEMRYFGVVPIDDFYSRTSMAIRSRLTTAEVPEVPLDLLNAQKTLLLRWFLEERQMEMESLEADIDRSMGSLDEILGLEAEDGEVPPRAQTATADQDLEGFEVERVLLEAILQVLPDGMALFTSDTALLDRLRAQGISFEQDAEDATMLKASVTGRDLVGQRSGAVKTWQGKTYTLLTQRN